MDSTMRIVETMVMKMALEHIVAWIIVLVAPILFLLSDSITLYGIVKGILGLALIVVFGWAALLVGGFLLLAWAAN